MTRRSFTSMFEMAAGLPMHVDGESIGDACVPVQQLGISRRRAKGRGHRRGTGIWGLLAGSCTTPHLVMPCYTRRLVQLAKGNSP